MGQYVVGGELSYDRASKNGLDLDLLRLKGRLDYDAGSWMPYDNDVSFDLGVDGLPDLRARRRDHPISLFELRWHWAGSGHRHRSAPRRLEVLSFRQSKTSP